MRDAITTPSQNPYRPILFIFAFRRKANWISFSLIISSYALYLRASSSMRRDWPLLSTLTFLLCSCSLTRETFSPTNNTHEMYISNEYKDSIPCLKASSPYCTPKCRWESQHFSLNYALFENVDGINPQKQNNKQKLRHTQKKNNYLSRITNGMCVINLLCPSSRNCVPHGILSTHT